jgi:hypothetical protein
MPLSRSPTCTKALSRWAKNVRPLWCCAAGNGKGYEGVTRQAIAEEAYRIALEALASAGVAGANMPPEMSTVLAFFGIKKFEPVPLYNGREWYVPTALLQPEDYLSKKGAAPVTSAEPSVGSLRSEAVQVLKESPEAWAASLERLGAFVAVSPTNRQVALFDAARYVGAVAASLEDGRIARVRVEFGGIQDFVYTVGSKYALKVLRGRSAWLDLFTDVIAHEISERSGVGSYGVLFAAGGNAEVVIPPSQMSVARRVAEDAAKFLCNKLGPELQLITASSILDVTDASQVARAWTESTMELHERVTDAKSAPHAGRLRMILGVGRVSAAHRACEICGRDVALSARTLDGETTRACQACWTFADFGGALPSVKAFVRLEAGGRHFGGKSTDRLAFGICAYGWHDFKPQSLGGRDYAVNAFDGNARRFWYAQNRTAGAAELQKCAAEAPGGYIGALRGDVDKLGETFRGLSGKPLEAATLSRRLTYAFRLFSNALVEDFESFVYAGGDDIFAVGAWDRIFKLALELRKTVQRQFPKLDISAGMALGKVMTPLYQFARTSGDLEMEAKSHGKGRLGLSIGVLPGTPDATRNGRLQGAAAYDGQGRALLEWCAWVEVDRVRQELQELMKMCSPRNGTTDKAQAFAYRLIEVGREFNRSGAVAFPKLAYALARSGLADVPAAKEHKARNLANKLLEPRMGALLAPIGILESLWSRPA